MHAPHIVWDWNGTLFDDISAVVDASNAAFGELGLPPMTVEEYRDWYRVPVIDCYADRLGRMPSPTEWERMDAVFHSHYTALRDACGLTAGAMELLVAQQSQSLLSMYGHEELVPLVHSFGIDGHFRRVDGRDGTSGTTGKGQYLVRHLAALGGAVDPGRTVLIGDVPDDAVAAAEAGVRAVLYTGGAGSRRELSRVGVPVADTLAEAVSLAEQLVA
ncbi:HAD family hydrolase [Streptacidiphilus pinicola]|uniref:HAD family hydrolase n=1 Tax=Streptacidiphilus pinicola TaxID=2219663 RepID=A0A2X0JBB2_9ACTN|nr:HAD hydrolase-like protein [Streptacidiphilus pinicola]RAG87586.1 HAD family hydrolase [Streptacidiphilus pinicola]